MVRPKILGMVQASMRLSSISKTSPRLRMVKLEFANRRWKLNPHEMNSWRVLSLVAALCILCLISKLVLSIEE